MKSFNYSELSLFESLCKSTQPQLLRLLPQYLQKKGYSNIITTSDYILAEGNIPIMLCCHLDTVFAQPPKDIYYDRVKNVILSPDGLGADDRAGLYSIINIIKRGYKPHIAFLTDEEVGALGAAQMTTDYSKCPFELRYIIELDRMSSSDAVFYDCDNPEFTEYIENFGFVFNYGSFSDISVICEAWGVAGVNLSVGYYNQHSTSEILKVGELLNTIDKVCKMLAENADAIPQFEFIRNKNVFNYYSWYRKMAAPIETDMDYVRNHCYLCDNKFDNLEMIPVKMIDGSTIFMCIDCIIDNAKWCNKCGEAYEPIAGEAAHLCPDCRSEVFGNDRIKLV